MLPLVIVPDHFSTPEFAPFHFVGSVTYGAGPPPLPPVEGEPPLPVEEEPEIIITSVTISSTEITDITFTNTTFTVVGSFNEAFNRQLTYLSFSNKLETVASFPKIPYSFNTLVKYVGPPNGGSTTETIIINFENHPSLTQSITVTQEYATANAMLAEQVKQGRF